MFDQIKLYAKIAWDYMSRHAVYVLLVLAAFVFLKPEVAEIKTFFFSCAVVGTTLFLSMLVQYAYTRFDFVNFRFRGVKTAREVSQREKAASIITLGLIFLSVSILVGLCVFGYYWTTYAPTPTPAELANLVGK